MSSTLPRGDGLSPEAQRARFSLRQTGVEWQGHPLTLLTPNSWTSIPPPDEARTGMDGLRLAAFWSSEGDGDGPLSLQVFVASFPREIAASHYLRRLAVAMEMEPAQIEPISPSLADSLVTFQIGKAPFKGRLAVRLYGPFMVAALAAGPASRYDEAAELYGYLVRATSLEDLTPGGAMEQREAVPLGPSLSCDLPASWSFETIPGPDEQRGIVDATSVTPEDSSVGRLRLKWFVGARAGTVQEEMDKLRQELDGAGLVLGPVLHAVDEPAALSNGLVLRAHRIELATLPEGGPTLEVQRLVLSGSGLGLCCTLISPARTTDFAAWALSRRALEIALETLRTRH